LRGEFSKDFDFEVWSSKRTRAAPPVRVAVVACVSWFEPWGEINAACPAGQVAGSRANIFFNAAATGFTARRG
jgi:hypothetical protein